MRFCESSTSGTGGALDVLVYKKGKTKQVSISVNAKRETITIRIKDIWGRPIRERTFNLKTLFRGSWPTGREKSIAADVMEVIRGGKHGRDR